MARDDRVPGEPGGARDDPEIWRIMQDEENGLRSPSPGRQHFLTLQHSEGRFPHQWPTPWRDRASTTRFVDGQDQNEAHRFTQKVAEADLAPTVSAPTARRVLPLHAAKRKRATGNIARGADRTCKRANKKAESEQSVVSSMHTAELSGHLANNDAFDVAAGAANGTPAEGAAADSSYVAHRRLSLVEKPRGTTANVDRSERRNTFVAMSSDGTAVTSISNDTQHSCGDMLDTKTKRRQARQRRWAGRAIEKMVRVGGQRVEKYVSRRKARGEDRQLIAHWKSPAFYEQLSRESGVRLPDTWSADLPVMCEACFASSISTLCKYNECIALQ